jgi:glycyl-tRNA synthetase beta chain
MKKDFLLEIGTEEIPAGYIDQASSDLKAAFEKLLADSYTDIIIKTFATPRRLAILIENVAEAQQDRESRRIGPPMKAAYDDQGNPTKAAIGFAKSQGVSVDDLTVEKIPKGEYLAVIKKEKGKSTPVFLAKNLPEIIKSIPFPKSMRWADKSLRFARPIHWIVALYGKEVVKFELDGIQSSNVSYGHRFLSNEDKPLQISTAINHNPLHGEREESDYVSRLRNNNVFPNPGERKNKIEGQLANAVKVANPNWSEKEDEELLKEVTYLVECPKVILGTFDEKFLALPDEVLITAMREHQKYFSVVNKEGKLVNHFLVVSNMDIEDTTLIRTGNERVLRARLTDAEFFYQSDTKRDFAALTDKLREIVFQEKLGTVRDKVERIRKIGAWLAPKLGYGTQVAKYANRAAQLCKNDLLTEMVCEFPKLQGIMGREYAIKSGKKEAVAQAIYEH